MGHRAMALWSSCIWSFYTASNPFVASYPGLVAIVYWQRDINQADYRARLVLIPKITKMSDPQCDLGHSNKEKRSFRGISSSSGGKLLLAEII